MHHRDATGDATGVAITLIFELKTRTMQRFATFCNVFSFFLSVNCFFQAQRRSIQFINPFY